MRAAEAEAAVHATGECVNVCLWKERGEGCACLCVWAFLLYMLLVGEEKGREGEIFMLCSFHTIS